MCLEIPACFMLFLSERYCCFAISLEKGVKLMWIFDVFETIVTIVLISLSIHYRNYMAQISLYYMFNMIGLGLRLGASIYYMISIHN